jgi:hypothetical protein
VSGGWRESLHLRVKGKEKTVSKFKGSRHDLLGKLVLALASTVILGSEYRGTYYHILHSPESGMTFL